MNAALYHAARKAGCTRGEAEAIAIYVEADTIKEAAYLMGVSPNTTAHYLGRVKEKLDVAHIAAAVTRLLAPE